MLIASIGKFAGAFVGGALGGLHREKIAGARLRHERARLDRGDRRHHRPVDGRAQPEPVLDDRDDGDPHHHGNAADVAWRRCRACRSTRTKRPGSIARNSRQKGFVANLERLLLAADESANAKFASHIAGVLAGGRGLPITVLHVDPRTEQREQKGADEESLETVVKNAARAIAEADDDSTGKIDITTRERKKRRPKRSWKRPRRVLTSSSSAWTRSWIAQGGFDKKIEDIGAGFKGPMAIVAAKGPHLEQPAAAASISSCRFPEAACRDAARKSPWRSRVSTILP